MDLENLRDRICLKKLFTDKHDNKYRKAADTEILSTLVEVVIELANELEVCKDVVKNLKKRG